MIADCLFVVFLLYVLSAQLDDFYPIIYLSLAIHYFTLDCFGRPKAVHHFVFAPATHQDSNWSTFLSTLIIVCPVDSALLLHVDEKRMRNMRLREATCLKAIRSPARPSVSVYPPSSLPLWEGSCRRSELASHWAAHGRVSY